MCFSNNYSSCTPFVVIHDQYLIFTHYTHCQASVSYVDGDVVVVAAAVAAVAAAVAVVAVRVVRVVGDVAVDVADGDGKGSVAEGVADPAVVVCVGSCRLLLLASGCWVLLLVVIDSCWFFLVLLMVAGCSQWWFC